MMHPVRKVVTDRSMVKKAWEEFGMDEQNRISCNKRAKNGDIKESLRAHMFQDVDTE